MRQVPPRAAGRAALWSALLIFLTTGYFQTTGPGANVATRFALTLALAERGTVRIDDYHATGLTMTHDKALFEGHFYSDKSPVTSLAGVPVVWLYRQFSGWSGVPYSQESALWLATSLVIGGSAAALAALLTLIFIERGLTPRESAILAAFWIAGTPLLGYSFLFYDYVPACALIAGAFFAAQTAWNDKGEPRPWRLLCAGILGGLACWTLNTSGIAAFVLTLLIAAGCFSRWNTATAAARVLAWVIGGMIGAAGFFLFNYALFGSIRPAYAYEFDPSFREEMAQGLMGAGWPRPFVVWLQTVHPFQGLFLWFPLTGAAVLGCLWMVARQPGAARREATAALVTLALFLLYGSGYYLWSGGASGYAPRHLIPALPLLAIGLIPWVGWTRTAGTWVGMLAVCAVLFNMTAVAVNPQFPLHVSGEALEHPEQARGWPVPMLEMQRIFWATNRSQWNRSAEFRASESEMTTWNLGRQLGLDGPPSLLPLLALWAAALYALPRWLRS